MVDGHKAVFGKRAVVFGDPGSGGGIHRVVIRNRGQGRAGGGGLALPGIAEALRAAAPDLADDVVIHDNIDFATMEHAAAPLAPDFMLGNSKGYKLARKLGVPLVRVGFPIHDRIGAQRVLHVGYRGMQGFFDQIVNVMLERKQDASNPGFTYL